MRAKIFLTFDDNDQYLRQCKVLDNRGSNLGWIIRRIYLNIIKLIGKSLQNANISSLNILSKSHVKNIALAKDSVWR